MTSRITRCWINVALVLGMLGITGCGDVLFVTTQQIVVKVAYTADAEPVPNATVVLTPTYQYSYLCNSDPTDTCGGWSGTTDIDGQATINVDGGVGCSVFLIFGTRPCPPSPEDQVTGETFSVRVTSEEAEEEVEMALASNGTASGELFTVTIVQVGDAYFPDQAETND